MVSLGLIDDKKYFRYFILINSRYVYRDLLFHYFVILAICYIENLKFQDLFRYSYNNIFIGYKDQ